MENRANRRRAVQSPSVESALTTMGRLARDTGRPDDAHRHSVAIGLGRELVVKASPDILATAVKTVVFPTEKAQERVLDALKLRDLESRHSIGPALVEIAELSHEAELEGDPGIVNRPADRLLGHYPPRIITAELEKTVFPTEDAKKKAEEVIKARNKIRQPE